MIVAGMHLVLHSIGRHCCHPETSKLSITAQPLPFDICSAPVEVGKTSSTLLQLFSAPGLPYNSMRIAISHDIGILLGRCALLRQQEHHNLYGP